MTPIASTTSYTITIARNNIWSGGGIYDHRETGMTVIGNIRDCAAEFVQNTDENDAIYEAIEDAITDMDAPADGEIERDGVTYSWTLAAIEVEDEGTTDDAAEPSAIAPGERVEAGHGEDHDTGTVDSVEGSQVTVRWDSGVTTTQAACGLRPARRLTSTPHALMSNITEKPALRPMRLKTGKAHPWIIEAETNIPNHYVEICAVTYKPLAQAMAAALELLEACQAALEYRLPGTTDKGEDVSDLLRAAIQKATA